MTNYFISYDLYQPGQNYEAVGKAIQQLERWAKVHLSLYYVSTSLTQAQVFAHVAAVCDANDKLIVITASSAQWDHLPDEITNYIKNNWN